MTLHQCPEEMRLRIEALASKFLDAIVTCGNGPETSTPAVFLLSRTKANVRIDWQGILSLGHKTSRRSLDRRHGPALARFWAVAAVVSSLLAEGRSATQRDIYYRLVHLFDEQRAVNDILLDICAALQCPRESLNVSASSRGVVIGSFVLLREDEPEFHVDGSAQGVSGYPIPGDTEVVDSMQIYVPHEIKFVLIIEKLGIFHRLVEDRVHERVPCILICGAGYPSLATRLLTARVAATAGDLIPTLSLTDHNPHGIRISEIYRRGSLRSGLEGARYSVPRLEWRGLCHGQIAHLRTAWPTPFWSETLTQDDLSVAHDIHHFSDDRVLLRELEQMAHGKVELQALFLSGMDPLQLWTLLGLPLQPH